jgi:O-antigen ligase
VSDTRLRLAVEEWAWLLAAALAPLALNPLGCSPFELPKAVLVQTCALVAVVFVWVTPGQLRRRPILVWLLLAYGAAAILATLLSMDRDLSLWGSLDRQQGLLTILAYLALAGVVATRLRAWSQAHRLLRVLVWASAPVVLYALIQALGLDPIRWSTDAYSPVFSTVGRSNFLGSYLLLIVPLTVVAALLAARRWPLWFLLVAQLLALLATQARAAWIGAAVALPALLVFFGAALRRRAPVFVGVGAGVTLLLAILALNLASSPPPLVEHLPGIDRLASLSDTSSGSTAARVTIWRASMSLILARPLTGYGPETTELAFAPVYPPQLVYYQGRGVVVDRLHNLLLDHAVTTGLLGLLAFLALLAAGFGAAARTLLRGPDTRTRLLAAGILAALFGHLVDLLFSFELTASAMVFYLLIGLAAALSLGLTDEVAAQGRLVRPARAAGILVVLFGVFLFGARPLLADTICGQTAAAESTEARMALAGRAFRLWPVQADYRVRLALARVDAGDFEGGIEALLDGQRRRGADPSLRALLGDLYVQRSVSDPAQAVRAEAQYRQAIALAPNIAAYHLGLGLALIAQGRSGEAIAAVERAVALDATYGDAYAVLAEAYGQAGRPDDAGRAAEAAQRWR